MVFRPTLSGAMEDQNLNLGAYGFMSKVRERVSPDAYDEYQRVHHDFTQRRVSILEYVVKFYGIVKGDPDLLLGLNQFLPEDSWIMLGGGSVDVYMEKQLRMTLRVPQTETTMALQRECKHQVKFTTKEGKKWRVNVKHSCYKALPHNIEHCTMTGEGVKEVSNENE